MLDDLFSSSPSMHRLLSTATVTAVGLTCKAILNIGFASITVNGLPTLLDALANSNNNHHKGVVTGRAYHQNTIDPLFADAIGSQFQITSQRESTRLWQILVQPYPKSRLDDPVTWGVLPTRHFLSSKTTRWALGASDIMFTNP